MDEKDDPGAPAEQLERQADELEALRGIQERRVADEAEQAANAPEDEERATHQRRADKAAYLRDKLAEQAEAGDE